MHTKYKKIIERKIILITGGTGSFGNSVVGKILEYNPKKIIIFSRDEKKQFDMRNKYSNPRIKFVIGDVRDLKSVENVMQKVDYVFHAAALKQVPTCEFFPLEAIKTNVLGAYNVVNSAIRYRVKKVVVLSTDKAAYPINVIGMTKALMEKVMIAESKNCNDLGNNDTVVCGVRYGNVLYTRGSVLPYFVSLLKKNKKLPVTHSDMTRFLLPLIEAVDLVLYALSNGENGYVYVRKSPACTLKTMAESICNIFNYKKGYEEVGIRAGEKMHETLVTKEELSRAGELPNYYVIPSESQGLDYNKYFFKGVKTDIEHLEPYTSENTKRLNVLETVELLLKLPEIQYELKLLRK